MNTIRIVLALALAAGAQAASAALAVYGQLQAEMAQVTNDGFGENYALLPGRTGTAAGETSLRLADNRRGRLGVKVREDLGADLAAIARFEWQANTVTGNLNDGAREAWVGLQGEWGELKAGRLRAPYKYTGGVNYDPFAYTYLEARLSGGMKGGDYGQNGFWDTSVSYRHRWGGFGLWLAAGLDQGDGTANAGNSGDASLALDYRGRHWEVFAAANVYDADNDGGRDTVAKLGGQLRIGGRHTVSVQYEQDNPDGNDNDAAIYFLGYRLRFGQNIIAAQAGRTAGDPGYAVAPTTADPLAARQIDTTYYALGVIHRFNKKVRLFAGFRNSDGEGNQDLSVYSAGLRFDF